MTATQPARPQIGARPDVVGCDVVFALDVITEAREGGLGREDIYKFPAKLTAQCPGTFDPWLSVDVRRSPLVLGTLFGPSKWTQK